jgi:hypothetical protein
MAVVLTLRETFVYARLKAMLLCSWSADVHICALISLPWAIACAADALVCRDDPMYRSKPLRFRHCAKRELPAPSALVAHKSPTPAKIHYGSVYFVT